MLVRKCLINKNVIQQIRNIIFKEHPWFFNGALGVKKRIESAELFLYKLCLMKKKALKNNQEKGSLLMHKKDIII